MANSFRVGGGPRFWATWADVRSDPEPFGVIERREAGPEEAAASGGQIPPGWPILVEIKTAEQNRAEVLAEYAEHPERFVVVPPP